MSDKFESKNPLVKSWIASGANFLSVPFCVYALYTHDFWLSVLAIAIQWGISEAWFSPAFSML